MGTTSLEKKFKSSIYMRTPLNIKKEPFVLLLFTGIVLLIVLAVHPISNEGFSDKVLFGISFSIMIWFIPLFLIFFWLLYLTTSKYLYSAAATWVHVITTVVLTLCFVSVLYLGVNPAQNVSESHELVGNTIQVLALLFLVEQIIFAVNFLIGIIKKIKS